MAQAEVQILKADRNDLKTKNEELVIQLREKIAALEAEAKAKMQMDKELAKLKKWKSKAEATLKDAQIPMKKIKGWSQIKKSQQAVRISGVGGCASILGVPDKKACKLFTDKNIPEYNFRGENYLLSYLVTFMQIRKIRPWPWILYWPKTKLIFLMWHMTF